MELFIYIFSVEFGLKWNCSLWSIYTGTPTDKNGLETFDSLLVTVLCPVVLDLRIWSLAGGVSVCLLLEKGR